METRTDMHHMHDRASISTATDRPAKNNITWVKIVSAYVICPPSVIQLTSSILKLILLVAFATAIAAGVLVGRDLSQERQRKVISNLLKASYVMTLGKLPSHM